MYQYKTTTPDEAECFYLLPLNEKKKTKTEPLDKHVLECVGKYISEDMDYTIWFCF